MHAIDVFTHYERNHWNLWEVDFDAVELDKVEPAYITIARGGAMGESNVVAAVHGFMNEFVDDYDFSTFAVVWGYQEVQHHCMFRKWLEAVGQPIDDTKVGAMRQPYAPGTSPAATIATNIISELTVNHVYKRVANVVKEPVLKKLLLNASLDEAGHAREFIEYGRRRIAAYPKEIPSMLEALYVYTAENSIKHPVSVFKGGLSELSDCETIDDVLDIFLSEIADEGELAALHANIRRVFGNMLDRDLETSGKLRRALAEAL
jgi:hypothetical protein